MTHAHIKQDGLWKHANPNAINFPFAPCPCGTGNVLSLQLGCNNVYLATLNFVRGNVTNRNGMLVTFQENPSLSYLIVTWAFLSDMAKATNGPLWRLFGKARYVGWILWKLIFSSPTEYPTRFWYWLNDEEEDGGTYHPCSPSIPGLAPAPPIKPQCVGPDDIAHYYEGPMSFFQCTVQRSVLTSFPKDSNHLHATVIMQNPRFWASFLTLQTYTIEAQEPNQSLREKFPEVYYWRVKALVMETLKDQSEVTLDGEEVQSSSKSTFAVELLPKSFYLIQPPWYKSIQAFSTYTVSRIIFFGQLWTLTYFTMPLILSMILAISAIPFVPSLVCPFPVITVWTMLLLTMITQTLQV